MSYPVIVREIKGTSNPEMMNVMFEQSVPKPVTDVSSLLNWANKGNTSFGSNMQKRVAFFNFSPQLIEELQLTIGSSLPEELNATLVAHEFCEGNLIPVELQGVYYNNEEKYYPRTWYVGADLKTKDPKMTPKIEGKAQQVLTIGGKPIFRETHLCILDMVRGDILIKHDNIITGSTSAINTAGRRVIGQPQLG